MIAGMAIFELADKFLHQPRKAAML
jgi:hypothetical protein